MTTSRLWKSSVTRPRSPRTSRPEYTSSSRSSSTTNSATMCFKRLYSSSAMTTWRRKSSTQSSPSNHLWCSWNTVKRCSKSSRNPTHTSSTTSVRMDQWPTLTNGHSIPMVQASLKTLQITQATQWSISRRTNKANWNYQATRTSSQHIRRKHRTSSLVLDNPSSRTSLSRAYRISRATSYQLNHLNSASCNNMIIMVLQVKTHWNCKHSHSSQSSKSNQPSSSPPPASTNRTTPTFRTKCQHPKGSPVATRRTFLAKPIEIIELYRWLWSKQSQRYWEIALTQNKCIYYHYMDIFDQHVSVKIIWFVN